ncbi:45301_t:CDS:2 [Gigaspora margarita]|uniref:45301_t:CDS:1 n=1 Tax=Gigaspora margarita TaxID=4874 RepID=A0ABN7UVF3_GIGMA|nr:45301_t:CDS:2 [Gigaspora margarita]
MFQIRTLKDLNNGNKLGNSPVNQYSPSRTEFEEQLSCAKKDHKCPQCPANRPTQTQTITDMQIFAEKKEAQGYKWYASFTRIKNKDRWCAQCASIKPCDFEACKEIAYSKDGSAIKKEREHTLGHLDPIELILWKVNIPIYNEDRMKMLDNKSHEIDVEQDLGGIELFLADGILEDFYEQQLPSVKIIYIIIQVPATWFLQKITNIYIIMFGAYGYYSANSAELSTPVEIPPSKCKSLLDIVFSHEELKEYAKKFSQKYLQLNTCDISKFIKYIQISTEGHVGLVFYILQYTKKAIKRQIHENMLIWKDIFAYLNSYNFNLSIDGCRASLKVKDLSAGQLKICKNVYLNGNTLFDPFNASDQYLVKSGIIVVDDKALHFLAPLIMRSFFQQYYESHNSTETTPSLLYHFIMKIFTAICNVHSGRILRETLGFGIDGNLLEQTWQKEFYRIEIQVLGKNHFLSCDVDGKHMAKHSNRFEPTDEYKEIVKYAKSVAIIDVQSESKKVRNLQKDFIHVSFSENYNTFKIESLGEDTVIIRFQD